MDEKKLEKIINILQLANSDFVSVDEFVLVIHAIIDGVNEFRKEVDGKTETSDTAFTKKINDFIAVCNESLKKVEGKAENNVKDFRKELDAEIEKVRAEIREIELTPGEKGEDAEFTEEDKEEITDKILIALRKEYSPELKKQVKEAVDEAVKNIKPTTTFVNQGGIGAPFEIPIKAGTNVTVTKDASGAYVIAATGGSGSGLTKETPVGDIDDSNVTFTVAHEPFFINVNGAIYEVGDGAYASYVAGTITLNYPVGTGGFIKSYY